MRKITKAALEKFQKQTGVRVKYAQPKAEEAQPKQQEVILTVPESLLDPLLKVIGQLLAAQDQMQAAITTALDRMTAESPIDVEVVERDENGNISKLSFNKTNQVRH